MASENKTVKVTEEYEYPGKNPTKRTYEYPPKKTVSDWVAWSAQIVAAGAVIVSIVALVIGAYQFKAQQSDSAQMQATQEAVSRMQTQDQQQQTTLDTYIDRMSDLLINQHLASPSSKDEVRMIAKARTLRALRNENADRKGFIISFLWEAQLIKGPDPIISLNAANLVNANMQNSYLNDVNLSGALVSSADLHNCDLDGAILTRASLDHVNFRYSTLKGADLSGADLSDAIVTQGQLDTTKSLKGATMPDGSIHP